MDHGIKVVDRGNKVVHHGKRLNTVGLKLCTAGFSLGTQSVNLWRLKQYLCTVQDTSKNWGPPAFRCAGLALTCAACVERGRKIVEGGTTLVHPK